MQDFINKADKYRTKAQAHADKLLLACFCIGLPLMVISIVIGLWGYKIIAYCIALSIPFAMGAAGSIIGPAPTFDDTLKEFNSKE